MHDTKTLTLLFIIVEIFSQGLLPGGKYIYDVAEWSRALDIRLSDWCRIVSML
jgi:hypothetical protein